MKEFTPAEKKFIQMNEDKDPASLMLQAKRFPDFNLPELVHHIQARQKIKEKLPTWYQTPDIRYPLLISTEQASSEKTAAFKANLVIGDILIDLTGGFGVDSYYFAKKIKEVFYIERNTALATLALKNASALGATNLHFHQEEAFSFLTHYPGKADWIYLDPARRDTANKKVHLLEDCEPDVLKLLPLLLQKSANILLKTSPMLDIQQAILKLQFVQQIYVIAVDNEVKEVLYHLSDNYPEKPQVQAVNLIKEDTTQIFKFNYTQEETHLINYAEPLPYIYEPNAAILKAGGFKSVAHQFALNKLHRNSHLYTSTQLIQDFPGRVFKLKTMARYQKKELLQLIPGKKANITVRNFPETVAYIRAKTGLREGGSIYLFATTDLNQKPIILICEKAGGR